MYITAGLFRFHLSASETLVLPSYKGSTLRGGFGYAFKRVVCAIKDKECPDCLLKEKCVYSYVFETPPPSDTKIMRKYKSAPHPFIIEPPPEKRMGYTPGSEINFGLTLIGRAIDYLPYFIYTFDELGKIGIGKGKGKYEMKTVECRKMKDESEKRKAVIPRLDRGIQEEVACETIYDSKTKTLKSFSTQSIHLFSPTSFTSNPSHLTLTFLTPTRILYNGSLIIDPEFHMLIRQLLRRISLLAYFHCNGDPSEWDFRGMIKKAEEVKVVKKELRWFDWERYSARQDTRMKMGGFEGEISFKGDIEPFMPLIRAGEVLHVGKGTSFGLGKYRIVKDISE